jgi:predicted anti-sigma-YlaC factor YlaD
MQNNECTYICEQFTGYQDDSLSSEIKARVDSHLAICNACFSVFQELTQVISQLHDLQPISTSSNFTNDLLLKIHESDNENLMQKFYHSSYTRIAGIAIAAGFVVAVGLNMWIDPVLQGNPRGMNTYTEQQNAQPIQENFLVGLTDSITAGQTDSLQSHPSTINSNNTSLQLVSGKK